jgi:hypothetical protein
MSRSTRTERVSHAIKNMLDELTIFKLSYSQWLDWRSKYYNSPDWQKATRAEKEYWRGYQSAYINCLYRTDLVWCHKGLDDRFYTSEDFRIEYGEDCYRLSWFDSNKSAHVWKGTQKAFNSHGL